jgi:hypothetical protein
MNINAAFERARETFVLPAWIAGTPTGKKILSEREQQLEEGSAEYPKLVAEYENLLKAAADADEQQKEMERELALLTAEELEASAKWSQVRERIRHLNSKMANHVSVSRSELPRLRALVYSSVPPAVEAKLAAASVRVQEIAAEAREASFEKNTNEEFLYDRLDLSSRDLCGCYSFKPLVGRLLHDLLPAANRDLDQLRFSTLNGEALDAAIASIMAQIPELQRVRCRVDRETGALVEA